MSPYMLSSYAILRDKTAQLENVRPPLQTRIKSLRNCTQFATKTVHFTGVENGAVTSSEKTKSRS
jgi:hypothetical protein